MRPAVTIYDRNGWVLTSQGNGAFYMLRHGTRSVFFQGDDADEFRARTTDAEGWLIDNCEERFDDYSDVMQEDQDACANTLQDETALPAGCRPAVKTRLNESER